MLIKKPNKKKEKKMIFQKTEKNRLETNGGKKK
jgi:hypothetical protein